MISTLLLIFRPAYSRALVYVRFSVARSGVGGDGGHRLFELRRDGDAHRRLQGTMRYECYRCCC